MLSRWLRSTRPNVAIVDAGWRCPIGGKELTIREESKLSNIEYCENYWLAKYLWIRIPDNLPNNYEQAAQCLEDIEKRLSRDKEDAKNIVIKLMIC